MPGPVLTPPACVPARFGLLSIAEVEDREDAREHWAAGEGYQYDVDSCTAPIALSEACTPTPENKAPSLDNIDTLTGQRFTLIAGYKCSVPGRSVKDAWTHAGNRLTQGENPGIERVFWTGLDHFGNPVSGSLGGVDSGAIDLTPGGGAVPITDGLALLEDWAGGNMLCAPVIHSTRGVATYLAERNVIAPSGQIMSAVGTGSRLAVGGGYTNSGPTIPAADPEDPPTENPAVDGEAWLYVSGSVKVLRSPMFFTPERDNLGAAINRETNDIEVYAERFYGFERNCGLAAIRVTLASCCS